MRILICGGRDFQDHSLFWKTMNDIEDTNDFDGNQSITIIEGGAQGADAMAAGYAAHCGWILETYRADWKTHGKAAGLIRNKKMLEEGKPDLVIAFPGEKGTAHMVKIAKETNIPVLEILPEDTTLECLPTPFRSP